MDEEIPCAMTVSICASGATVDNGEIKIVYKDTSAISAVFVRKAPFVETTTKKIRRQDNPLSEETIIGFGKEQ